MSYKGITTVEEAFKRFKLPINFETMKSGLAFLPGEISKGMIALAVLQVAAWSVNNDDATTQEWIADFNDTDQEKWFPWYTGGDASGSGWSFDESDYGWTSTLANGGARLALKDEERSDHMHRYFEAYYKDLWLMLKSQ